MLFNIQESEHRSFVVPNSKGESNRVGGHMNEFGGKSDIGKNSGTRRGKEEEESIDIMP